MVLEFLFLFVELQCVFSLPPLWHSLLLNLSALHFCILVCRNFTFVPSVKRINVVNVLHVFLAMLRSYKLQWDFESLQSQENSWNETFWRYSFPSYLLALFSFIICNYYARNSRWVTYHFVNYYRLNSSLNVSSFRFIIICNQLLRDICWRLIWVVAFWNWFDFAFDMSCCLKSVVTVQVLKYFWWINSKKSQCQQISRLTMPKNWVAYTFWCFQTSQVFCTSCAAWLLSLDFLWQCTKPLFISVENTLKKK